MAGMSDEQYRSGNSVRSGRGRGNNGNGSDRQDDLQGYSSGRRGYASPSYTPRNNDMYSRRPAEPVYHDRARERVVHSDRDRSTKRGRYDDYNQAAESKARDARETIKDGASESRGSRGIREKDVDSRYDDRAYSRYDRPRNSQRDRYEPRYENRYENNRYESNRYDKRRYDNNYDKGYSSPNNSYDKGYNNKHEGKRYDEKKYGNDKSGAIPPEELIEKYQRQLENFKDVQPIEQIKVVDSRWGVKPKGFEAVTAQRAKLSGLFPLPGHPRPVDFTKLEGAMNDGSLNSNDILIDSSKIDPVDSRTSKILIVQIDFDKVNYLKIVEFFNDYLRRIDIDETSTQNIDSKRKTKDDRNLIISFNNNICATIIASLDSLKLPFNLYKEESEPARDPQEKIVLKVQRPNEYVVQVQDTDSNDGINGRVVDSPKKVALHVSPEKTETQILDELATVGKVRSFQLLREIGTKESLGIAFVEFDVKDATIYKEIDQIEALLDKCKELTSVKKAFFACITPNQTSIQDCPIDLESLKLLVKNQHVSAHPKSKVIQLINIVTAKDLIDDDNFQFIQQDIQQELSQFGKVVSIKIPRPANDYTPGLAQFNQPGLGKVFIEFEDEEVSLNAIMQLAGRYYNDRVVICSFYDWEDYQNGLF